MPSTLDAKQTYFVTTYLALPLGESPSGADEELRQTVEALRQQLGEDIALVGDRSLAEKLGKALAAIDKKIDGGALKESLTQLQKVAEVLASEKGAARSAEASQTIPGGMVGEMARALEMDIATLRTHRLRSVTGLEELVKRLREEEDGDLREIADRIDGLIRGLPAKLEDSLGRMKIALDAGDPGGASVEKSTALGLVGEAASYLSENETELALCEENPFGIGLDVVQPLTEAVQSVRQSLARL